jgi:ketosteroid isomerase-like protein
VSQENVDLLVQALALANSGDLEAVAALYHPDVELRDLQHPPDAPEVLQGRAAVVAAWRQWLDSFDGFEIELHDFVDADPWIIGDVSWRATGKGSEASIDWRVAEAYEVKDGKIVRVLAGFANVGDAVKAVELEE